MAATCFCLEFHNFSAYGAVTCKMLKHITEYEEYCNDPITNLAKFCL